MFAKKYWNKGIVDIRNFVADGNTKVALYMSTYIVKAFKDINLNGYRVYGYSHKTIKKPKIVKMYLNENIESVIRPYLETHSIKYSSSHEIGYITYKGDYRGNVLYFNLFKNEI